MRRVARMLSRRNQVDDSGSALILVLLVVLFAGLVMSAVLDFTRAGLTIAPKARDLRNQDTYLQGAVDAAINNIRGSTALGRLNGPTCPTFNPPGPSLPSITGAYGSSFSVSCTPLSVNGVAGGAAAEQPDFAILALGTGSDGITQAQKNGVLLIDGGIYSHGVIASGTLPKSGLDVNGSVYAEGSCSGNLTSTDPSFSFATSCNYSPPAGSGFGSDPQYLSALPDSSALASLIGVDTPATSNLGADPLPTCSGGRVHFSPGFYSATPAQLVADYPPGCSGTFVFGPGVYYFDYTGTWTISDTVIGGTLSGSTCDQSGAGVQFVFGGKSQVNVTGSLELCGPQPSQGFSGLPQRIAMYGLSGNGNNNTTTPAAQTTTLQATVGPTSTTSNAFGAPTNAQRIGETPVPLVSSVVLPKNTEATLTYTGFEHIPKGAKVQSVQARIVQAIGATDSAALTTHIGAASDEVVVPTGCASGCLVDITSQVLGAPGAEWRNVNALGLDLTVMSAKKNPGAASVDGLELRVTYTPPALEAQTCNSCDFFVSGGSADVLIHGTVYTPAASMVVDLHNKTSTAFDRGIIIRTITTSVSASLKQLGSPFSLPAGTPRGRLVLFKGSVRPAGGQFTELLRACVLYTDGVTSGAASGVRAGYQITIRRWSLLHSSTAESPDCH